MNVFRNASRKHQETIPFGITRKCKQKLEGFLLLLTINQTN